MSIEQGLVTHLIGNAGVAALVVNRVYPLVVPQDAEMPALAYQRISGGPDYAHDGATGLVVARYQFTCQAESYGGAKDLAAAVRSALSGYSGTMGDVTVDAVLIENDRDGWSRAFLAPVVRLDAAIWYQET